MIEREQDRRDAGMYERAMARIERSAPVATPERSAPPRERETSGQFRSSEPVYGEAKLERDAGYKRLPEERDNEIDSDRISIRDASNERAKQLQERPIEVHESGLDEKVTLSVEQAAKRVEEARQADVNQADLDGTKAAQKAVDDLRNPHGVEPQAKPIVEAEPDIEKVLKHPKIAKALADRVAETETQRTAYESAVRETGKMRIAALASDFPELMNLPLDKWAGAINAIGERDLPRARKIYGRLQALGEVETALTHIQSQKDSRAKAAFGQYSARENERFKQLTRGMAPAEMAAVQAEVPAMMKEYGVENPRAFLEAIQGQTTFPRASAERMLIDAAKYRLMQKAAKAQPTRAVPPMMKPGVAQNRGSSASSAIQALNQKLSQTGNIKDAAALLMAKRKARR
jgi:hypothetical protein